MCGLVGLISKNTMGMNRDQQEVFASLLFVDLLRGADSTGAFVVDYNGNVVVAKDATHSVDFIRSKEYDLVNKRAFSNGMALIGHNRKATRGDIVDRNAHPFNVDNNIILVHNGTMTSDHKKHADVEVDSHAIAHLIHEKKDVGKALSEFYGAYALIWYDVQAATINMIRNDQRPLWWMETPNAWIWASTPDMLEFVRHRHDLKPIVEPTELSDHVLQTFKLDVVKKAWDVSNSKVELTRKAYSYTAPNNSNGNWPYPQYQQNHPYGGHRRHSFRDDDEDGWETYARTEWGIPADNNPPPRVEPLALGRPMQQQPQRGDRVIQLLPRAPTVEPIEFPGIMDYQRKLATESNNIITHAEYNKRIVGHDTYRWGREINVVPFDYSYVNNKDSSDGFYLYAAPVDGDAVILRQYIPVTNVNEERILQLASGGYLYAYTCGAKEWGTLDGRAPEKITDDTPGYVIVRSQGHRLLQRPTVGDMQMH